MESKTTLHNIDPVWNKKSKILILGSFPSVKSRENKFFYSYKYNRFWKVISTILNCDEPSTIAEKKQFLLDNNIALWDVIESCEIVGSSDSSISSVKVNDITPITNNAPISMIFTNGSKANALYKRYLQKATGLKAILLPSTSPANATYSLDKLVEKWSIITNYL